MPRAFFSLKIFYKNKNQKMSDVEINKEEVLSMSTILESMPDIGLAALSWTCKTLREKTIEHAKRHVVCLCHTDPGAGRWLLCHDRPVKLDWNDVPSHVFEIFINKNMCITPRDILNICAIFSIGPMRVCMDEISERQFNAYFNHVDKTLNRISTHAYMAIRRNLPLMRIPEDIKCAPVRETVLPTMFTMWPDSRQFSRALKNRNELCTAENIQSMMIFQNLMMHLRKLIARVCKIWTRDERENFACQNLGEALHLIAPVMILNNEIPDVKDLAQMIGHPSVKQIYTSAWEHEAWELMRKERPQDRTEFLYRYGLLAGRSIMAGFRTHEACVVFVTSLEILKEHKSQEGLPFTEAEKTLLVKCIDMSAINIIVLNARTLTPIQYMLEFCGLEKVLTSIQIPVPEQRNIEVGTMLQKHFSRHVDLSKVELSRESAVKMMHFCAGLSPFDPVVQRLCEIILVSKKRSANELFNGETKKRKMPANEDLACL